MQTQKITNFTKILVHHLKKLYHFLAIEGCVRYFVRDKYRWKGLFWPVKEYLLSWDQRDSGEVINWWANSSLATIKYLCLENYDYFFAKWKKFKLHCIEWCETFFSRFPFHSAVLSEFFLFWIQFWVFQICTFFNFLMITTKYF